MKAVESIFIPLQRRDRVAHGGLRLDVVPGSHSHLMAPDARCPRVQVLEDCEVRYTWQHLDGAVRTSHPELFWPDDGSGHSGRLRPGRSTGTVLVRVFVDEQPKGTIAFEIRSRKLQYESEYRWMLRDITERFTELVLLDFGAGTHRFAPTGERTTHSLYQRFAFLASVLESSSFQDAIERVLQRPKVSWVREVERRNTASGIPPSSSLIRQVVRSAHPVPWPAGSRLGIDALPRRISVERTIPTVDNPPNRFVRFALESFRDIIQRMSDALTGTGPSHLRGREESAMLLSRIDEWLAHPMFRQVGPLRRFPSGSTVLQNQAGYRHILRIFLLSDVAARLAWDGGETVFGAGKRDVATLYEYWTWLELASIVGSLCNQPIDPGALVKSTGDGIRIGLRAGSHQVLAFTYPHPAGALGLRLHYNRGFSPQGATARSWTRHMRPDASLEVMGPDRYDVDLGSTWLHFDAKYRVDGLEDVFGTEPSNGQSGRSARRDDLLKMHAYRDAIVHSAGAYVLFPGDTEPESLQQYTEILPGLGAFPLRPTESGPCAGRSELKRFLLRALTHLGHRSTARERDRYWRAQSWMGMDRAPSVLVKPPADTLVGLGLWKSEAHRRWSLQKGMYCVRADPGRRGFVGIRSRFLQAEFLVLYGGGELPMFFRVGEHVSVLTRAELLDLDYPAPGGDKYLALELSTDDLWHKAGLSVQRVEETAARAPVRGTPLLVSFLDLEPSP